jgi:histidine ammonia-lyase
MSLPAPPSIDMTAPHSPTAEPTRNVRIGEEGLTIAGVDAVARRHASVELGHTARHRVERCHAFLVDLAETGTPVYGLTTGCGPLAEQSVSADSREEFQRNLVRSHAVTLGTPHPSELVRAALLVRAHVLAKGHSGVDPQVIDVLLAMLRHDVHPVVREVGGVGASGDLLELAEIALAVIGEGWVEQNGRRLAAADALRAIGVEPVAPRHREGLALMNGTSFHTGAAAVLTARAQRLVAAAQIAAAMGLDALQAHREVVDHALQMIRPHAGQRAVADRLRLLLEGSTLVRNGDAAGSQDAYTLRCVPQILGPVVETLSVCTAVIETELDAVSDNPLFLPDEGRVVHGGNFHGQVVAMALDQLKAAMVEAGVLSERRLARLLDAKLNAGLPPFLVHDDAGRRSGFMGLQYCASSMAADNAVLAAPASIHSVPTNANNQDVVGMGMVAARQTRQVIDNVMRMVAIELVCTAQALDLRGAHHAGRGTRGAHRCIRRHCAPLTEDRPLQPEVAAVCRSIESGELEAEVGAAVG